MTRSAVPPHQLGIAEGGYWEPNALERVQWEECVGCYGTEGRFVCVNPECES